MLTAVAISNYRSLRNIVVPLRNLNIVTGPNGSSKSSFYRALRLLADTAQGRVVTHAAPLISALVEQSSNSITLEKSFGETRIAGLVDRDVPAWHWPSR